MGAPKKNEINPNEEKDLDEKANKKGSKTEEEDEDNDESVNENDKKNKSSDHSNFSIKVAVPNYYFPSNKISTTQYTILNFFPKNLFLQFKQPAYLFFVVILILQLIPVLSISENFPTASFSLAYIVIMRIIVDLAEDIKRWKLDKVENNFEALLVKGTKIEKVSWADIYPGQIIQIKEGQTVPADCVLLYSSNVVKEFCRVETKDIDGQTNLVLKSRVNYPEEIQEENPIDYLNYYVNSKVTFDEPNSNIETFNASLELVGSKIPLSYSNLLLRHSTLRDTDYVFAVVIYTGPNTKIMKMSLTPRNKLSMLNKKVNDRLFSTFLGCIVLSAFAAGYHLIYIIVFKSALSNYINYAIFNFFQWFLITFVRWNLILLFTNKQFRSDNNFVKL